MKRFFTIFFILCGFLIIGNANGAEQAPLKGPEINLLEPDYKFQTVLDGFQITHDFIIQNLGDEVLNIEKVKTT